jgi:hypothetical protein
MILTCANPVLLDGYLRCTACGSRPVAARKSIETTSGDWYGNARPGVESGSKLPHSTERWRRLIWRSAAEKVKRAGPSQRTLGESLRDESPWIHGTGPALRKAAAEPRCRAEDRGATLKPPTGPGATLRENALGEFLRNSRDVPGLPAGSRYEKRVADDDGPPRRSSANREIGGPGKTLRGGGYEGSLWRRAARAAWRLSKMREGPMASVRWWRSKSGWRSDWTRAKTRPMLWAARSR